MIVVHTYIHTYVQAYHTHKYVTYVCNTYVHTYIHTYIRMTACRHLPRTVVPTMDGCTYSTTQSFLSTDKGLSPQCTTPHTRLSGKGHTSKTGSCCVIPNPMCANRGWEQFNTTYVLATRHLYTDPKMQAHALGCTLGGLGVGGGVEVHVHDTGALTLPLNGGVAFH